ncbi:sterol carrier family protein [Streptomyces sp. NPDC005355]|uniref:sterol carrier family protein n=1 Tax=Streptomyces sp. NPDC005355 TaxID=3157038 RepID=UPI0033B28033
MPPRARARARMYDPAKTRAAVTAQLAHVRDAVRELGDERLGARLSAAVRLEDPAPSARELTVTEWATATAAPAEPETEPDPGEPLERAAARFAELIATAPGDRLVAARGGAMRLDDFLVTRCVELIVHTDDLATATGVSIPYDRHALATASRVLADALAAKAPGGSVEVRVPPFAVVQCVEGPRHTRGTPPNVIETAPLPWIRLATGRLPWPEAVESAQVTASGERADLSPHLPVLT